MTSLTFTSDTTATFSFTGRYGKESIRTFAAVDGYIVETTNGAEEKLKLSQALGGGYISSGGFKNELVRYLNDLIHEENLGPALRRNCIVGFGMVYVSTVPMTLTF